MFLDQLRRIFELSMPDERKLLLAQKETEKIAVAEQVLERNRIIALHKRYDVGGAEVSQQDLTTFSPEETFDLGVARKGVVIYDNPFKSLFITKHIPLSKNDYYASYRNMGDYEPKAYLQFNFPATSRYEIRNGVVRGTFNKLFLTNEAQAGFSFSFVVSNDENAEFGMRGDVLAVLAGIRATQEGGVEVGYKGTLDLYNEVVDNMKAARGTSEFVSVTMDLADTEYSYTIPINTKNFKLVLADNTIFRIGFIPGRVAAPTDPYWTQPANKPFEVTGQNYSSARAIYFASPAATKVMQIYLDR